MTPKAQQIGSYDVPEDPKSQYDGRKTHKRGPSSISNLSAVSGFSDYSVCNNESADLNPLGMGPGSQGTCLSFYGISNRVTSAINPSFILLVATPIAMQYPLIRFIIVLTLLIGTSPLYFIMITFTSKNSKFSTNYRIQSSQCHRRQRSCAFSRPPVESCWPTSLTGSLCQTSEIKADIGHNETSSRTNQDGRR